MILKCLLTYYKIETAEIKKLDNFDHLLSMSKSRRLKQWGATPKIQGDKKMPVTPEICCHSVTELRFCLFLL